MHFVLALALVLSLLPNAGRAQETIAATDAPLGIGLEGFGYPYAVRFFPVARDGEALRMAYMDVAPSVPANGRAVLLLHGRNFPSSYWQPVIQALTAKGYRVVAVDQLGFGKSAKPVGPYSLDTMAAETAALLDRIGLPRVDVVAHSMGGMLAVRLARNFPKVVNSLVLEAPIGLEDYRFTVPPVSDEVLLKRETDLTAEAYRQQLVTNYALSLPDAAIDPFVSVRERVKGSGEYPRWLQSFVSSYQMIWGQPVVHEIPLVRAPTLFVMGANDRNAPGKPFAPPEKREDMGENAKHAQELAAKMRDGRAVVVEGVGHLVHMEASERFNALMLDFLDDH